MQLLNRVTLPHFQTERLELRSIRVSDYKALFEIFSNKEYLKYFGIRGVETEKDLKLLLKDWIKRLDAAVFLRWAIVHRESGKVIGSIGLHSFIVAYKKASVGYELNPHYQHKGYIQEALQMIMRYFYEDLGYHRLEAIIAVENIASIHVAERAGFICEGLMRKWMYNSDYETYYDAYLFALLDTDYTGEI